MENATDALKIAFGVFIFIVALAISFGLVSQAKKTADVVFYHTDRTNFYEWMKNDKKRKATISDIVYTLNRIAEGETITVSIIVNNKELVPQELVNLKDSKKLGTSEKEITALINRLLEAQEHPVKFNGQFVSIPKNAEFDLKFVETHYTGIYKRAEDGTEITISPGGTREYITFIYPAK